jgi:hypothetical protein
MTDTSHVRGELVRTGLLNVQHWFDHGSELLSHGPLGDWQTLVIMAEKHLIAVLATLRDGAEDGQLATQLDATIKATNAFWYASLAWCTRNRVRMDRTLERAMDRIYEKIDQARWLLDPPEVIELTHARAGLVDDVYEAMAVPPVLELARREAEVALIELAGKDAHVTTIVERVTRQLELRCDHAEFLLDAYEGDARPFTVLLDAAIAVVDALHRAIIERARVFHCERIDRLVVRMSALRIGKLAA